jgi:starch phosphorylase
MMNGALTLGTLDGANIEIAERAGEKNCFIFGLTEKEVENHNKAGDYNPWDVYNKDPRVKNIMDSLFHGPWVEQYKPDRFRMIFEEIMNRRDEYYILADLDSYIKIHEKAQKAYQKPLEWQAMAVHNVANSGFFSSDRTIKEYATEIWKLEKIK